jgi:hypothetical protein
MGSDASFARDVFEGTSLTLWVFLAKASPPAAELCHSE